MRVGVFHPGTQNSWQRALAAQEAGALAWYLSALTFPSGDPWAERARRVPGAAGARLQAELGRRSCGALDPACVRRAGTGPQLAEVALRRLGAGPSARRLNARTARSFARQAVRLAEREPVDLLWTHDGKALEAFRWAKTRGILCVLDQSIGHPAALAEVLADDRARHPVFHRGAPAPPGPAAIARADAELALADLVLVGSAFARATLLARGVDAAKLRVVPYGFDETLWPAAPPPRPRLDGRPLELLFVGAVTPRKGVPALLQAIARVPPGLARLTMVGRLEVPRAALAPYRERVRFVPQVPRQQVPAWMATADVLVLPSLFEGASVVLFEALGAGLAVIRSQANHDPGDGGAAGPVLPAVTASAIEAAIRSLAEDPAALARCQTAARTTRIRRRWADYRAEVRPLLGLPAAAGAGTEASR
jgi:glycosyltransferase involved in cell wall biosynthesis